MKDRRLKTNWLIICKPSIDQFSHDLTTLVLDENEFFEDPSDKIYQLATNL